MFDFFGIPKINIAKSWCSLSLMYYKAVLRKGMRFSCMSTSSDQLLLDFLLQYNILCKAKVLSTPIGTNNLVYNCHMNPEKKKVQEKGIQIFFFFKIACCNLLVMGIGALITKKPMVILIIFY